MSLNSFSESNESDTEDTYKQSIYLYKFEPWTDPVESKYFYKPNGGYIYNWIPVEERLKLHDLIAESKEKERLICDYNNKTKDEIRIENIEMPPLQMSQFDNNNASITTNPPEDIELSEFRFRYDYFKYGRKVYSLNRMTRILQETMTDYTMRKCFGSSLSVLTLPCMHWKRNQNGEKYWEMECPFDSARRYGFTWKELMRLLPACQVGVWMDPPADQFLEIVKKEIELKFRNLKTPEFYRTQIDSLDYESEYYGLLSRWLADYPRHNIYNKPPDGNLDPNKQFFPLPPDTRTHLSVLRPWIDCWKPFNFKLPDVDTVALREFQHLNEKMLDENILHLELIKHYHGDKTFEHLDTTIEGNVAWSEIEPWNEQWPDAHILYFEQIKKYHGDDSLEPFNMTIEGDVAWDEIEMDLVKNDTTTDAQDEIWNKRATRGNLTDPTWMAKRRSKIARSMKERYQYENHNYNFDQHIIFVDILEKHWKEFQQLCEES